MIRKISLFSSLWAFCAAGCGPGAMSDPQDLPLGMPELGTGVDMAMSAAPDLLPAPDFSAPDLVVADLTPLPDLRSTDMAFTIYNFVSDSLILAMDRSSYSVDLDGDGNRDNLFGKIFGALTALDPAFDFQTGLDQSVKAGATLLLIRFATDDATFNDDPATAVTFGVAAPIMNPDLNGTGSFVLDGNFPAVVLHGPLIQRVLSSENPVTTKNPLTFTIRYSINLPGTRPQPFSLVLHGAHTDMRIIPKRIGYSGLQGSVTAADMRAIVIPKLAGAMTAALVETPGSAAAMAVTKNFDNGGANGGCTNPDNSTAKAADGKIDPCELTSSGPLQTLLQPDMQIYDVNGKYAPTPKGMPKDSFSFGLGYLGMPATF